MARLLAVSLTEPQVVAHTKTVTRRMGWWEDRNGRRLLSPGDHLTLVRKSMGRRRADGTVEPLHVVAKVVVLDVRRERLDAITPEEVAAEGFPDWTPEQFVEFFCRTHRGCTPSSTVTRIKWGYLPADATIQATEVAHA